MSDNYRYNANKPSAMLLGYGTVRGAELKEIHELLERQGEVPVDSIKDRFGRPSEDGQKTDHVRACLRFLRTVDYLEVTAQDIASRMNTGVYPEISSFESRLLHHIRQQTGKQYQLTYVNDVLINQDQRRITEEELLEAVQEDDQRNFDIQWRGEKIRMWANLMDHLGAISYSTELDENEIYVSPSRVLFHELLAWYAENGEDPDRFVAALKWIDKEFIPVFSDRPGVPTVNVAVADTLQGLVDDNVLSMNTMSDTQNVAEVPQQRGSSLKVSTYSLEESPVSMAYSHPLDRDERRVEA